MSRLPMPPGYRATTPVPGTGPVGEPGERDPGDCESDGHYLCYSDPGCVRFMAREAGVLP